MQCQNKGSAGALPRETEKCGLYRWEWLLQFQANLIRSIEPNEAMVGLCVARLTNRGGNS